MVQFADRIKRYNIYCKAVQKAYLEAISDAVSDFDDGDAEVYREAWVNWMNNNEDELHMAAVIN